MRTECGGASKGSGPQQLFRQGSGQLSRVLGTVHTRPSGVHWWVEGAWRQMREARSWVLSGYG